jgi:hypothetical protein
MTRRPGYERSDISARAAIIGVGGVLALAAIGGVSAWGLLAALGKDASPTAPMNPHFTAPGPRLQSAPRLDRAVIERRAQLRLESYGWVDRPAGLAHIPIDRAMTLQAERGWPDEEGAR